MNGQNKKLKKALFLFILLIVGLSANAQDNFRILFYNVENMYDTKDNPDTNDDDFTPTGQLRWNDYKYWKKLNDISKVISSVGKQCLPALVGLCEVENDSVLYDLTKRTALREHKYEYIITRSKDLRGSNTALLYQRDQIRIIGKNMYTPFLDSTRTTRDILHVTGKIVNGDTLDVFVCHFPSRREGINKTRPFRITCAELLKQKTDSLFSIRRKANIIIMGDFNDYPTDTSMRQALGAHCMEDSIYEKNLYNMFYQTIQDKTKGTYKYRGKWNYPDQFVVSGNLLIPNAQKTGIKDKAAHIYSADFLFEKDAIKYGGLKPFRTYLGYKYPGGYSDHLPIYIDMK